MKSIAILFFILSASAQLCGLFSTGCDNKNVQQVILYKYDDDEYPDSADLKINMYSDDSCTPINSAMTVTYGVPLKDCVVNATDYTNCQTSLPIAMIFTMVSNTAATSLGVVCDPPLADGQSIDILTTSTHCMVGGMIDIIGFYRNIGTAAMVPDVPLPLKRVGDKLYTVTTDMAYTIRENTGCLAPTEAPVPPSGLPVGYIILIVAVVLLVSALVGFAIYKYSHKDHHLTERINRV